jgi:hypothetical protein
MIVHKNVEEVPVPVEFHTMVVNENEDVLGMIYLGVGYRSSMKYMHRR